MLNQRNKTQKELLYYLVFWEVAIKTRLDVQEIYWGNVLVMYYNFETNSKI